MRSKWKPSLSVLKEEVNVKNLFNPSNVILSKDLQNSRVDVYNGKKYISMVIKDYMVEQKLSKYVVSKYTGKNIHVKRKKRNNKR